MQESNAQCTATLLSLHQEVETQESTVDLVATPQEPAIAAVTVTQELVTPLNTPMKLSTTRTNNGLCLTRK
jgi:hypothetical protein